MTSPSGSIGIGVSIDAGDLTTEITQAVQSAMSSVVSDVRSGMGDVESVLANVDTGGFDQVAQAARDAQSAMSGTGSATSSAASGMDQVTRAARDAAGAADAAARAQDDVRGSTDQAADANDRAKRSYDDLGSGMDGFASKAVGAAAGIAGITAAMDTAMAAIEQKDLGNKLAAQLNLSPEEQAKAGKIAGDLYANAYGESFAQVNDALGAVTASLGNMTDSSEAELSGMTKNALDLSKAFDVDVAEAAQSAGMLIRNGFAKDGTEAFDLITGAMQNIPTSMRGELFPIMDEYGTYFQSIGYDGSQAMGLIVNAAQNGAIGMDKAGDAIKEFGIKATDLGDTGAQDALKAMGMNAGQMSRDLLAGGDTAQIAFQEIVDGLRGIKDPADQAAAAVALFGTPLEDLDKGKIPGFLDGLSNTEGVLGDVTGRAVEMGDKLNSGPGAALDTLKRQIEQTLIDTLGGAAKYLTENQDVAKGLAIGLGALAGGYVTLRVAAAASSIATGVSTAATGANTAALTANKIASGAAAVTSGVMKAAQVAGTVATGAATAAQWALNAALTANPIGLIVAAIAGLVAGLVLFFTKTELGKQIWQGFVDFLSSAWETIKGAFSAAWAFIQPILQGIWDFVGNVLSGAFNALSAVVSTVFNAVGAVISAVWNNVISPIFNFWKGFFEGILFPLLAFFWNQVVAPVFNGIGNVISTVWNTIIKVAFDAFKVAIDALGAAATWLWQTVIVPVWDGIGAAIRFVWENVIRPAWDGIKAGFDALGAAANWLWNEVIRPAWDGIGAIIRGVIDNVITPAWDGLKSGLSAVGDFFRTTVDGIGRVWNGIRNLLAKPINFMIGTVYNEGIRKAWNKVAEFVPGLATAPELSTIPEFRTGGALRGPGTGTSDDILMYGSNGEHMVTAAEVLAAGGHNVLYAIRDMILRGVPFEWDGGQVISKLGQQNLSRYGAAVQSAGLGNADPQGMFDRLIPRYRNGGPIEPWHEQLMNGHRAAKMRDGNPYTWGFEDCSGYMSMIADAIINGGDGVRRWATGSFPGGQPWVPGLGEGFSVGVHDNPGGPGGGHTAGTLSAVGPYAATNVESGGAHGRVAYGGPAVGADSPQWDGVRPGRYHLEIGANGFFQSGGGGGLVGPSPAEQKSWLEDKVHDVFSAVVSPVRDGIVGAIGSPPPEWVGIPPKFLDHGVDKATSAVIGVVGGLGDALSGAWQGAKNLLDKVNPFDSGGIANGIGFMPKNVIAPERVLSPEQTKLFEELVNALTSIARGGAAPAPAGDPASTPALAAVTVDLASSIDAFRALIEEGNFQGAGATGLEEDSPAVTAILDMREGMSAIDAQGQVFSDTLMHLQRTDTSAAEAAAVRHEQSMRVLNGVLDQLAQKVLLPTLQKGFEQALSGLTGDQLVRDIGNVVAKATAEALTAAVRASAGSALKFADGGTLPGYTPGRDVHQFYSPTGGRLALSGGEAVMVPEWTRSVGGPAVVAAMNRAARRGGGVQAFASGGTTAFGNIPGGDPFFNPFINALTSLIGVELEVRDLLTNMAKDVRAFRADAVGAFTATGELISDTSMLIDRTETSKDTARAEQERLMKQIIGGTIKYLITTILIPVISALLGGLVTMAVTAIGGAIGGPVGALIGAVAGAALGGLVSVMTGGLGAMLLSGVDAAFDEGGIANGMGVMPKNTIAPERVLSPRQTVAFERMVDALESGAGASRVTVHAPFTVTGNTQGGQQAHDRLLTLLN